MGSTPFARAIADHHRGEREEPLVQRDGVETLDHPIEAFYFGSVDPDGDRIEWLESWFDGPLLELGAGVGRDALYFQERWETVAVEVDDALVEAMDERGVDDARRGDMFALPEAFDRDRFRAAFAYGTQLGLVGSVAGLREFLGDLARVTTSDATAVLDNYDPAHEAVADLLGYRHDPAPGLASRVFHFEYEDEVGPTLLFRLFGPDRLRDATIGTPWEVAETFRLGDRPHYLAALEKT